MFTAQELKSLNELEMLVYQYVTEHRSAVPYMRIRELATEAHVSTTTVLHFCKKMGCEGFSQFKWKLKEENGIDTQDKDIPDALNELQTFFWRVGTPAYREKLEQAAAIIARMERIFVVGIGNSGSIASYGARYFSNLGKRRRPCLFSFRRNARGAQTRPRSAGAGLHPAGCHRQRELHPGPGVRPDPALLHGRSPQRRGKLRFDVADPRRLPAGIPGPPGA